MRLELLAHRPIRDVAIRVELSPARARPVRATYRSFPALDQPMPATGRAETPATWLTNQAMRVDHGDSPAMNRSTNQKQARHRWSFRTTEPATL